MAAFSFRPRLLDTLSNYNSETFIRDLLAGLTVGIVALPLAIAFAIASGVTPQAGLFTAVIAGFLISALGGTRVCIGGPTGAFIVIVYGIVLQYGVANLLICTVMAGIILVVMGVTRMGGMIKFIPQPLIIGFTNGIAILIFITQIKDFLGLSIDKMPSGFFATMASLWQNLGSLQPATLALSTACFLTIWFWPKSWARRVPAPILVLALGTAVVAGLQLPVATIGSRFGELPQGFPAFVMPDITLDHLRNLIAPAITIALLSAIESLLCAVVADGMTNDRHDSNQELVAQGIANIVTPFFGGIPATGAIARTATNIKNGAQTPVAGIIHALVLLLIIMLAAPLAKFIPLCVLAAILVVVSLNMGEWHEFRNLRKYPKSDNAVLITTFLLTVIFDLTVAVEVGMVLAAALFIKRASESTLVDAQGEDDEGLKGKNVPEGVLVFRVFGQLFFGAADKLEAVLQHVHRDPEVLILQMNMVVSMDATALNALESIHEKLLSRRRHLILCGPHTQPYFLMHQSGFFDRLGRENLKANIDDALERARVILRERALPTEG